MQSMLTGPNAKGINVYVFYQICPECREPIVGVREKRQNKTFVLSSDVQDLALLTKQELEKTLDGLEHCYRNIVK